VDDRTARAAEQGDRIIKRTLPAAFESAKGAHIQTSRFSSVIRITGIAFGWIGSTALASSRGLRAAFSGPANGRPVAYCVSDGPVGLSDTRQQFNEPVQGRRKRLTRKHHLRDSLTTTHSALRRREACATRSATRSASVRLLPGHTMEIRREPQLARLRRRGSAGVFCSRR
jgi:hypothetical protein